MAGDNREGGLQGALLAMGNPLLDCSAGVWPHRVNVITEQAEEMIKCLLD